MSRAFRRACALFIATFFVVTGVVTAACIDLSNLDEPYPADADGDAFDAAALTEAATNADAADVVEADTPYCVRNTGHDRCFDFDTVGAPSVGWDKDIVSGGAGGGTITLDRTAFKSPPASMRSAIASGETVGGTFADLFVVLAPHPSSVTLAFDLSPEANADGGTYDGQAGLFALQSGSATELYSVSLNVAGDACEVRVDNPVEGGIATGNFGTAPLGPSTWTRVKVTVVYGDTWHVRVWFDDVPQLDRTIPVSTSDTLTSLAVGLGVIGTKGGPFAARYDNVTIDFD